MVVINRLLSEGIFVVWIPAVFASHKLIENSSEKDSWKIVFKPRWIEYIISGLFAYGIIHYFFCLYMYFIVKPGGWDYLRIRGESGAVIPWYATATVILYHFWRS